MKPIKVKVVKNIWGNYVCFIGKERDRDYGQEFDAKCWLAEKVLEGCKISDKSDFDEQDVEMYKKYV